MDISWNDGYTTELPYTYGYYKELNPTQIQLLLLARGYAVPKIKNACELGFGQGVSINIHAAASEVSWYGTDFSPVQVNFAKETARASGTNVHLYDDSFAEFAKRSDLPQFDYIALHGIWSWISDENRAIIVDFIKNKLNVGGMLYISYNTLPGHYKTAPLRKLLTLHEEFCGVPNVNMVTRISTALDVSEKILSLSTAHCNENPHILDITKGLRKQDHNYLAHEYLNKDWEPMYFEEMAKYLEPAKLSFVTSAAAVENLDSINYGDKHKELLQSISNPVFKETIKDFLCNQQFRRDIWIKGPIPLNKLEIKEALEKLECILLVPSSKIPTKVPCYRGEADFTEVYKSILEVLKDNQIHTVAEIIKKGTENTVSFDLLLMGIIGLMSQNSLGFVKKTEPETIKRAQKFNMSILDKFQSGSKIQFLANPLTGGAIHINYIEQICCSEYLKSNGKCTAQKLVKIVLEFINAKGLQLINEGKTLQNDDEKREVIQKNVSEFLEQIPILKNLEILPFKK